VLPQSLRADPLPPTINLLQGPYASRRRGSSGWFADLVSHQHLAKYRLAAGIAAAALAVHILGTLADWARLSHENSQLRAEMRQVFKDTFPQTQAIIDPSLQMRRQLADLRRAHGYVDSGDFLHAVNAITGQVSGVHQLNYENSRLTLVQPRATDLDGLRTTLAAQGYQMATQGEPGNQSVTLERSQP
jgi:type II secretion system protein L